MSKDIRIMEVSGCCDCHYLDQRWTKPPWDCTHPDSCFLEIYRKNFKSVPSDCPLDKKPKTK
jgi:hypothetical protein